MAGLFQSAINGVLSGEHSESSAQSNGEKYKHCCRLHIASCITTILVVTAVDTIQISSFIILTLNGAGASDFSDDLVDPGLLLL